MGQSESPFDLLAEKYDAWYDTKGRLPFEVELAALRPLLPSLPRPWLEVGVGTGRFARELGIDRGIEPSSALLAIARRRRIDAVQGRGEEMPFPSGSFGTVFLLTTWEFLAQPLAVLREVRRVLTPDGRLVNGYLDRDGAWGAAYVEKGRSGHPLFSQARFGTYAQVARLTREAGFKIEATYSTLFQGPDSTVELEEPCLGYRRGASFVVLVARPVG